MRRYQERVRDKGLERRTFMERLQSKQREAEVKLELESGTTIVQTVVKEIVKESVSDYKTNLFHNHSSTLNPIADRGFPPCPLCDRPLDQHY